MKPIANLATEWYQWEVRAAETNLTSPFVFRVVNAQGTTKEQTNEGFWSTSWFLSRDDKSNESVTLSPSTTSSLSTTSSTVPTSLPTSSPSPSSTTKEIKPEDTAASATVAETHENGLNRGTIIGLTVGLVVAGATIIVGLLYYLKKRQKKKDVLSSANVSAASYYDKSSVQMQPEYRAAHEAFTQPPELPSVPPCYELPGQKQGGR